MRYIPATHKHARLWVEAAAASLNIEKNLACEIYARLCGFPTWSQLMLVIGNLAASPCDEDLSTPLLTSRLDHYSFLLVSEFRFNPRVVGYFLSVLSPSSSRKPKKVSIDTSALKSDDSGFTPLSALGVCKRDTDKVDLLSIIRGFKAIDPSNWYVILTHLGWKIPGGSCAKSYRASEPSFHVFLAHNPARSIPVFILPVCRLPGDEGDEIANEYLDKIDGWMVGSSLSTAIVFWGSMLTKKIAGLDYTHPGLVYRDGQWQEFLMNMASSRPDDVLKQANGSMDITSPPPLYSDTNKELLISFYLISEGIEDHRGVNLCVASTPTGWGPLIALD